MESKKTGGIMARRRRGSAGNPILMVVMVILTIVAVIIPIVLIAGYGYYRFKFSGVKKFLSNSVSDFWLDDDEKKTFHETNKQLILTQKYITKATDKGMKAGISLNMDGSFSARSNIGKEVRSIIEQNQPIRDQLSDLLDEIANGPINRWNEFNTYTQRAFTFFWTFCCWTIAFAITVIVNYAKQKLLNEAATQGLFVAAGVALISFFIFSFVSRNKGSAYSPKPPVVSLENVDSYSRSTGK
ncbi:MAG: hypothetical protein ACOYOS_13955 [Syntrophales bacterium]